MSWERSVKSAPCPCGKGQIQQEVKSDDWNRFEESVPVIECDECSQIYRVEKKSPSGVVPRWKEWTAYYLTPIDYPAFKVPDGIQEYGTSTPISVNLEHWLIENFTKPDLENALREFVSEGSCAKVRGTAQAIVAAKKRYCKSAKVKEIVPTLEKAIIAYDGYDGSFNQRKESEEKIAIHLRAYEEEKSKHQILIEI